MLLAKNWWAFLLRGILALIFGVVALLYPGSAFVSLVLIFGAFAFVNGLFAIIAAFTANAKTENWWWLIFEGVIGLAVGIFTIFQPVAMGEAWLLLIAAWAIVTGVLEIITAIRIRKLITGEFWLILGGLASIIFGLLVAFFPLTGAIAIGAIVGVYAIIIGVTFIALSLGLKKFNSAIDGEEIA